MVNQVDPSNHELFIGCISIFVLVAGIITLAQPVAAHGWCYESHTNPVHDFKATQNSRYRYLSGSQVYWHNTFTYQGTKTYWPWDYWWEDFLRSTNVFDNSSNYLTDLPTPHYWFDEEAGGEGEEVEIGTKSPSSLVNGRQYYSRAYFILRNHGTYTMTFECEVGPYGQTCLNCWCRMYQVQDTV